MAFVYAADAKSVEDTIKKFKIPPTKSSNVFVIYMYITQQKCVVRYEAGLIIPMENPIKMKRVEFDKLLLPVPDFQTFTFDSGTIYVPSNFEN